VIIIVLALQAISSPIVDWQPFTLQRTPDGGLFDRTTAKRRGEVVEAWVRLVNVQLRGVNEERQQTDVRMEVDCAKPRMRIVASRVVDPDGSVRKTMDASPKQSAWQPVRIGMRGADVRTALCGRVR
jgi:hypothetical protein